MVKLESVKSLPTEGVTKRDVVALMNMLDEHELRGTENSGQNRRAYLSSALGYAIGGSGYEWDSLPPETKIDENEILSQYLRYRKSFIEVLEE